MLTYNKRLQGSEHCVFLIYTLFVFERNEPEEPSSKRLRNPVKCSACAVTWKIETDCLRRNLPISNDPVVRTSRNLAQKYLNYVNDLSRKMWIFDKGNYFRKRFTTNCKNSPCQNFIRTVLSIHSGHLRTGSFLNKQKTFWGLVFNPPRCHGNSTHLNQIARINFSMFNLDSCKKRAPNYKYFKSNVVLGIGTWAVLGHLKLKSQFRRIALRVRMKALRCSL